MSIVKFTATKLADRNKKGLFKPDSDGYYEIVVGGLNVFNSVGEYYTLEGAKQLFEESSPLMRRIQNGCLKAEVGHPKQLPGQSMNDYIRRILTIEETNVCAHFKSIWLDTTYGAKNPQLNNPAAVAILAQLKPAGPKGNFLKEALEDPHQNVCFSIRALTEDYIQRGQTYRVLNTVVTWDYVTEPGLSLANKYDSPALESLAEHTLTVKQLERIADTNNEIIALESSTLAQEALANISSIKPPLKAPLYSKW